MFIFRKPFIICLLILFTACMVSVFSRELFDFPAPYSQDQALIFAKKFHDAGMYDDAVTECKRFLFFNPQAGISGRVISLLAFIYFKQGKWNETIAWQNHAIVRAQSAESKNEFILTLCKYFIAMKRYSEAEVNLLKMFYFSDNEAVKRKASFYLGISYLYRYKWEKAEQAFSFYFDKNPLYTELQKQKLFELLHPEEMKNYKSELLAVILSVFIPGFGQLYAGDFSNGIVSLAINGGLGYCIYLNIMSQDYSNAAMIFFNVFDRYYRGNLYNAQRLTREYNEKLSRKIADSILDYLLDLQ